MCHGGGAAWGPGGHVQVSSYGNTLNTCRTTGWSTGVADFTAGVACQTPGGAPADSYFDLLFVW